MRVEWNVEHIFSLIVRCLPAAIRMYATAYVHSRHTRTQFNIKKNKTKKAGRKAAQGKEKIGGKLRGVMRGLWVVTFRVAVHLQQQLANSHSSARRPQDTLVLTVQ